MMHIIHLYNKLHADCLLLGSHLKMKHVARPLEDLAGAIPRWFKEVHDARLFSQKHVGWPAAAVVVLLEAPLPGLRG